MIISVAWLQRLRFFLITGGLYISAISFTVYVGLIASAPQPTTTLVAPVSSQVDKAVVEKPIAPTFTLMSGKPVRLVIAGSGIDLPVDEGFYNQSNNSWTLSDTRLQYAMMTMPANNHSGNTLIYGHGTDKVLGNLAQNPPATGATAEVYTDSGQVFTYTFQSSRNFTPDDTSIFTYSGPPILTVQTCTGPASEWRTMYTFDFQKVAA
jgi:hypothetical protein